MTGLLDTSVVLGPSPTLPDEVAISVITIAELKLGVLVAASALERASRLERLVELERTYSPLPVDDDVASAYATLVAAERSTWSETAGDGCADCRNAAGERLDAERSAA